MTHPPGKQEVMTARAEAAAWLARLRSEERTAEDEQGFRAWLAESPLHREAFELTNSVFDMAGAADRSMLEARPATNVSRRHFLRTGVGLAAASVAGLVVYLRSGSTYATDVGEQRKVVLEDGTRVQLDTDTEIRVSMNEDRRRVRLKRGRAHFDVAHDPSRPFEVIAGAQSLTAARSHFDVSLDGVVVAVLLEDGPVSITPEDEGGNDTQPRLLAPGQRLVFAADKIVREERPEISRAIAWRDGRLAFFEDSLAEAVAEMNRYSRRPIVILDPQIGQLRISGNYSVGDPEAFAVSLSVLLPVTVDVEKDRVTLRAAQAAGSASPPDMG
ncbi:MAG TPA: FecR domain-containing protein [Steroidobacter sp.]|uniref:FecR family protein n=1 Tax=Steroidobacter sp. TaxID=1978227 RepID=UPI002ED82AB4